MHFLRIAALRLSALDAMSYLIAAVSGIICPPRRNWSHLSAHHVIILTRSSQNSARA